MSWCEVSVGAILHRLVSDETNGLTAEQAKKQLRQYGPNITAKEEKNSALKILLRQFKSFIIFVLIGAALISFFFGDHIEFIVITSIVLFIVLLSFFEEYKATKDMDALKKLTPKRAKVVRNGQKIEIDATELVPGDILLLVRGDIIPADARLIEINNLQVDESAMTGESVPITKKLGMLNSDTALADCTNMVFAGGHVMNGHARCVVVETGRKTELGKIAAMVKGAGEIISPLQRRVDKLGKQFSDAVLALCAVLFAIGLLRGQPFEHLLLLVVAVAVSGIPESLPAVIGVALAVGMKRMAKKGAVIKRLPAVETLGTCTVICTDKTGTLTQNKMVIEHIWAFDSEVNVTGEGFNPQGIFLREDKQIDPHKHAGVAKILDIGIFCNNADLENKEGSWRIDGESTEGALIVLAKKAGLEKTELHAKNPRLHEHPFDAERKCMSTIHMKENKPIIYAKGAPEHLLERSAYYLENGRVHRLTKGKKDEILQQMEAYADAGLRVLGLAYKEHKGTTYEIHKVESELIFAGLVSIRDPPEPSALKAITECMGAGIKVVMITGDNPRTAKAIASELGIFTAGNKILTGDELEKLSDEEFKTIVDDVAVYARVTPKHKLRVVQTLQAAGHIVAMTGDGVNDAPALKKADIGVAMGLCGTEVAKEASEMIITDDNFSTIVDAVKEGRTIYSNIRRFIYYLLAGNFSEVILIVIAALLGVVPPLTPLMILFINLVTSDLPAIGLCMENPPAHIMRQRPRDPREGVLSDYMLLKISQVVPIIVLGTIALYMWELIVKNADHATAQTVAFVSIISFELFHIFNAKSFDSTVFSRQTFTNWVLYVGYGLSIVVTLAALYWAPFSNILGTVPLSLGQWLSVLVMGSVVLIFVEIQKTILTAEIKERNSLELHPTRR